MDNDRGVFNVTKIRYIMVKMIYNDIYEPVDAQMSCSNIGARKKQKLSRSHKHSENIDIQIYDVAKLFVSWVARQEGEEILTARNSVYFRKVY